MELFLENICAVETAKIELENITVIAGDNGTGKSTISKALFAVGSVIGNLEEQLIDKKISSFGYQFQQRMREKVLDNDNDDEEETFDSEEYINIQKVSNLLCQFLEKNYIYGENNDSSFEKFVEKLKEEETRGIERKLIVEIANDVLKEIEERSNLMYLDYMIESSISEVFAQQANNLYSHQLGKIYLKKAQSKKGIEVFIFDDYETKIAGKLFSIGANVIYIETKHPLDINEEAFEPSPERVHLEKNLERMKSAKDKQTLEQYQEQKHAVKVVDSILEHIVKGKLVNQHGTFYYQEVGREELINMRNVASGLKNLLVVAQLVKNGSLKAGDILIIDEPETNQHPKWQVAFAELLVLLNKDLNIKVLINSHSPYFIRAIECKMAQYETLDKAKFYLMGRGEENGFIARDVTSSTEDIYKELYQPLEEL